MNTLLLTADDIRTVASAVGLNSLMDETIARLTAAFDSFDPACITVPTRQGFVYDRPALGLLEWMPCMSRDTHATIKIVGYHPENARTRNLPTILSTVSTYDIQTGHLTCLMDGTFLTAVRTGAASAVATALMASGRAEVVGLIGAGAQAVTQLHAISRVLRVRRVLVYDCNPRVLRSFPARAACVSGSFHIEVATAAEIVERADVICTATSIGVGEGPLFNSLEPRPWAHFNAVGSDFRGKIEIPAMLLKRAFVCPDLREQAMEEGECQQLQPQEIGPNLFEVVQRRDDFRWLPERLTVFDSTGWALEDHVTMELLVRHARQLGVGTSVAIETVSTDALNPYQFIRGGVTLPEVRLPELAAS